MLFSDGALVSLERLLEPIMKCKELQHCPKICIILSCRGSFAEYQGVNEVTGGADKPLSPSHSTRDRFIFWSSPPGNNAFSPISQESVFIKILCDNLDKYGDAYDLESIARLVNKEVCDHPPILVQTDTSVQRYSMAPQDEIIPIRLHIQYGWKAPTSSL